MLQYDLVVRGGTLVTATETMRADVGVVGGKVAAIADRVDGGQDEIDASGLLVLPGGVDSHMHVEQRGNPSGPNVDTFVTATTAAACGGTTTVICFARQVKGETLEASVADYQRRASRAVIDYAFHLTVTDPTESVLKEELPRYVRSGNRSIKIFMTTARSYLDDGQILNVLAAARQEGALVAVHAENYAATHWLTDQLYAAGLTDVKYSAYAKSSPVEREAVHRIITFAELLGTTIQIFHVSTNEAVEEIARAQARGVPVFAETCPQYLLFSTVDLEGPVEEAVRFSFGPPARSPADQEALWNALRRGVLSVVSSDHAPHSYGDPDGKLAGARKHGFGRASYGIPGVETRLPLLFSEGVGKGRVDINTFVALTSTNPAKLFGLYPRKGSIAIGGDADIAIWDPAKKVTISNGSLHHRVDYTPYEGMTVTGWPVITLSRGEVVWAEGRSRGREGRGQWLGRQPYDYINQRKRFVTPFDPVMRQRLDVQE